MESKLACSFVFAVSVLIFSGCSSTRNKVDDDDGGFYGNPKRSMGEKIGDWWDRSREREENKFERMFDSATG